jgi:hypothetical protein
MTRFSSCWKHKSTRKIYIQNRMSSICSDVLFCDALCSFVLFFVVLCCVAFHFIVLYSINLDVMFVFLIRKIPCQDILLSLAV